jgi:hypothetical protein
LYASVGGYCVAWAGVSSVGTFAKSTSVGPQTIPHTLGTVPKVVLVWTSGQTVDGTAAEKVAFSIGATDGIGENCLALGIGSGGANQQAATQLSSQFIVLVQPSGTVRAAADWSSWDESGFTIQWTANDASVDQIHFLAIGGGDLQGRLVNWTMPTSVSNQSVTGVGFKPDVLIHLYPGSAFTGTLGTSIAGGFFGIGTSTASAGASTIYDQIANGVPAPALLSQTKYGTTSLLALAMSPTRTTKQADLVSMDADGFTMHFTTADSSAARIFTLALGGFQTNGQTFSKPTAAPNNVSLSGMGFQPSLMMLTGYDFEDTGVTQPQAKFVLGFADPLTSASSGFATLDSSTDYAAGLDCSNHVACIPDQANHQIEVITDLVSFNADGLSLHWTLTEYNFPDTYSVLALRPKQSCGTCETADAGTGTDAGIDAGVGTDGGTGPMPGRDGGTSGGGTAGSGIHRRDLDVGWSCDAAGGGLSALAMMLVAVALHPQLRSRITR